MNERRQGRPDRRRLAYVNGVWAQIVRDVVLVGVAALVLYAVNRLGVEVGARTAGSRTNTLALCALRNDLQDRVDQSEGFLKTNPNGFAGIPAATIRTTVSGQQRTILALSIVRCPKSSPMPKAKAKAKARTK